MKLRNRKTGEIIELVLIQIDDKHSNDHELEMIYGEPITLEVLNKYCEDYKPTEPLIKDEKIRKAVRAWAEALGLQEVYCASNGYEIYGGIDDYVIQFEGEPFPFADKNKIYALAELCGEEEE